MQKRVFRNVAASSLMAMCSATWAQAAQAQVSAPRAMATQPDTTGTAPEQTASSEGPGDIIVTARRRAESLQDVPQTVNVVNGNTLEKLNFKRFEDISAAVPGLTLTTGNNGYSTVATIRGAANFVESGASPTVAFYLNDTLSNANILFQTPFDIGQIEVLRGPQGTLRGQSAPSGAITVTTRRPDLQAVGGYADITGSSRGLIDANAAFNLPIIKDVLAIRVAALVDQSEFSEVHSINNGINPYSRSWAGRLSVRFEPTNNLSFNFMYQHLERRQLGFDQVESFSLSNPDAAVVQPIIRGSERQAIGPYPRQNYQLQNILTMNASWRFAGQRLIYAGSYTPFGFDSLAPQDIAAVFPDTEIAQLTKTRSHPWSHEVRLESDERLFGFLDYVVGAFYSDQPSATNVASKTPVTLFGNLVSVITTPIVTSGTNKETSEFGTLTAHIGDKTELSGGVRHIDYSTRSNLYISGNLALPVDKQDTAWVYNASLSHRLNDNLLVYATTGTSWREGPYQIGVFSQEQTTRIQQFTNLRPERSRSYEIGFKSDFLDKRLRFNISAFHQTYKNFIYYGPLVNYVSVSNGVAVPSTFHFGASVPAVINGVDVDAAFQLSQRFNIGAAFSYAKGHIKNGVIACNDLNGDGAPDANPGNPSVAQIRAGAAGEDVGACRTNERLSHAPNWSLTVQSEYNQPITSGVNGFLRGLLSYYPDNPNDPDNAFDNVKAYGLLNLYLGIRSPSGAWEVSAFAKNITDTGRVLTRDSIPQATNVQALQPPTFRTAAGTSISSSYVGVTYTQPREFGLNIRYSFGSR